MCYDYNYRIDLKKARLFIFFMLPKKCLEQSFLCNNFIHNHWMVPNSRPIFYDLYITSKYSFLCPFSFMCFKKCFIIFFMIFLDFQFDVFPLEYMKNKEIGFSFIQVGNMSNFKSRNNWVNPLLVLFLFTGPIILAKGMIWYNEELSKIYTGWSKKKYMIWSRGKVFEKF